LDRSLRYWNNAQVYRFAWLPSLIIARVIVAIIKIPKKKTPGPSVKEKRKAGTRAGLTKPAIVAAAAKLIESAGANGFSLRKLAKALGVGPTTIHFHFEGGVGSVFSAVAQQALAGVTRPFKPKEEPAGYLGELLLKILEALHARPTVAKLVVLQLSSNPVLDPLLAERLLLALAALGVPPEARPKMFQRAMGVIFEMVLAESGRSSAAEQKEASAQMHKTIASLSPTEFPNLTELRAALVAETVQGGASKPSPEAAAEYADRLIATLGVK
jgi:AcrR family transcriptional regulator